MSFNSFPFSRKIFRFIFRTLVRLKCARYVVSGRRILQLISRVKQLATRSPSSRFLLFLLENFVFSEWVRVHCSVGPRNVLLNAKHIARRFLWNSNFEIILCGLLSKRTGKNPRKLVLEYARAGRMQQHKFRLFMFQWCSLCKYYFINSKTNKQSAVFMNSISRAGFVVYVVIRHHSVNTCFLSAQWIITRNILFNMRRWFRL